MRTPRPFVLTLAAATVLTSAAPASADEAAIEVMPEPAHPARADSLQSDPLPRRKRERKGGNAGLVIGGAVILATSYAVAGFTGIVSGATQDGCPSQPNPSLGCYRVRGDLMLPVLGPLVDMAYSGNPSGAYAFDVLDGLAQVGGLAMLAFGVGWDDGPKPGGVHVALAPMAVPGGSGVGVVGRF